MGVFFYTKKYVVPMFVSFTVAMETSQEHSGLLLHVEDNGSLPDSGWNGRRQHSLGFVV